MDMGMSSTPPIEVKKLLSERGIEFFEWVDGGPNQGPILRTNEIISQVLHQQLIEAYGSWICWEKLVIAKAGAVPYNPECLPTPDQNEVLKKWHGKFRADTQGASLVPEAWQKTVRFNPDADKASMVSHPPHYNQGRFEVIEVIEDWKLNYHRGNSVKYIARAGRKDPNKEIEDLEKAVWYLNRDIEKLKAVKENREALKPNNMVKR